MQNAALESQALSACLLSLLFGDRFSHVALGVCCHSVSWFATLVPTFFLFCFSFWMNIGEDNLYFPQDELKKNPLASSSRISASCGLCFMTKYPQNYGRLHQPQLHSVLLAKQH